MENRLDPQFKPILSGYEIDDLDAHPGSIYGLWSDMRLAFVNLAWHSFAAANGGEPAISVRWPLGESVARAFPVGLKTFLDARFNECLKNEKMVGYDYECSSPQNYRRFHQFLYPLGGGAGILVVNSLIIERPHDEEKRQAREPSDELYLAASGFLTQCAHCRRMRRAGPNEVWDWVPSYVESFPSNTSHGLCPTCFAYFYKQTA